MNNRKLFPSIPLKLPRARALARLGYNRHLTELDARQLATVEEALAAGFALCQPQGVMVRVGFKAEGDVMTLENGGTIASASLAKMLAGCGEMLLVAATMGGEIVEAASEAITRGDGARGAIFDAVGSETADACLDWLQDYAGGNLSREGLALTKHRFSPGYGDLQLSVQSLLYKLLHFDKLGVSINDRHVLIPEKSVIGIVGIAKGT